MHYVNLNVVIGTEDCAVEEVDVGEGEKVFKVSTSYDWLNIYLHSNNGYRTSINLQNNFTLSACIFDESLSHSVPLHVLNVSPASGTYAKFWVAIPADDKSARITGVQREA